jgi:6-phosphogluconolactonase
MRSHQVHVLADQTAVARAVAAAVADVVADAVQRHGRCAVALSGGTTPRALYRVLATEFRTVIPWAHVRLFWGDERFVSHTDRDSNYGMAKAELLDHVPVVAGHVAPIPTHLPSPSAAADAYAATLRGYFGDGVPRFDLVLLGIGADGHIASLFPQSPALTTPDRLVTATQAPGTGHSRITLTLPVFRAADTTFVVATGATKAHAVARALAPDTAIADCPAAALRDATGVVVWWTDRAAAGELEGAEKSSHGEHGESEHGFWKNL